MGDVRGNLTSALRFAANRDIGEMGEKKNLGKVPRSNLEHDFFSSNAVRMFRIMKHDFFYLMVVENSHQYLHHFIFTHTQTFEFLPKVNK